MKQIYQRHNSKLITEYHFTIRKMRVCWFICHSGIRLSLKQTSRVDIVAVWHRRYNLMTFPKLEYLSKPHVTTNYNSPNKLSYSLFASIQHYSPFYIEYFSFQGLFQHLWKYGSHHHVPQRREEEEAPLLSAAQICPHRPRRSQNTQANIARISVRASLPHHSSGGIIPPGDLSYLPPHQWGGGPLLTL